MLPGWVAFDRTSPAKRRCRRPGRPAGTLPAATRPPATRLTRTPPLCARGAPVARRTGATPPPPAGPPCPDASAPRCAVHRSAAWPPSAAGCGGGGRRPDTSARQKLDWSSCPAPSPDQDAAATKAPGGQWECATLHAPLDYRKPHGRTIGIGHDPRQGHRPAPPDRLAHLQLRRPRRLRRGHPPGPCQQLQAAAHPLRPGELRPARGRPQQRGALPGRPTARRLLRRRLHPGQQGRGEEPAPPDVKIYAAACEKNSGPVPRPCRHHQRRPGHGPHAAASSATRG
ncbi:hypothetical protein SANTM175S_03106 [Streptomyces antimycoticus]